jgi:hypothetical protein
MKRNDQAVKVDAEIVKQAKIVATHRGVTVAEYLSETLRGVVAKDYREAIGRMASEMPAPAGDAPKPPRSRKESK